MSGGKVVAWVCFQPPGSADPEIYFQPDCPYPEPTADTGIWQPLVLQSDLAAAIARAEAVAYMVTSDKVAPFVTIYLGEAQTMARVRDGGKIVPLYAHPTADAGALLSHADKLIDSAGGAKGNWSCACGDMNAPNETCGICNQSAPQPAKGDALVARCRAAVNACEAQRMPATAKLLQEAAEALAAPAEGGQVVGRGIGMHALAGEIAAAVASDEKNGGCDLSAGMFGPAMSAIIRTIATEYLAAPAASVDVGSIMEVVENYAGKHSSTSRYIRQDLAKLLNSAGGAKVCTCPSGDGSLRWPCPTHPPQPAEGDGAVGYLNISEASEGDGWQDSVTMTAAGRALPVGRHAIYTRPAATAVVPDGLVVLADEMDRHVARLPSDAGKMLKHYSGKLRDALAAAPAAPKGGVVDFEIHAGGEYFASVGGPRDQAVREALHYVARLHPEDGEPEVFEVTRTPVPLAALNPEQQP